MSDNQIIDGGLVRIPEACRFLGISRTELYDRMADGEIRYAKIGRARRIPLNELKRFAAACLSGKSGL